MRRWFVALLAMSLAAVGAATTPAAGALDAWEPPQVVPRSDDGRVAAFFTTQRGRAVMVHKAPGGVFGSSRPRTPDSGWTRAHRFEVPRFYPVGPVATGRGGGATVFLGDKYSRMSTGGTWGPLRTFRFYQEMQPTAAIVTDDASLVAAGVVDDWDVKVAVRAPGDRWRLSPALSSGAYTVLRGLWTGADGRTHVLVTRDPEPDDRVQAGARDSLPQGLYESVLRRRDGELSWGRLREWSTGSVGELYEGGASMRASVLHTDDGAITAVWYEFDEAGSSIAMLLRHRDAAGTWSPVRRVTVDAVSWPLSSLAVDGDTRLTYLKSVVGTDETELLTRRFSAQGVLSDPVRVDGPLPVVSFRLDGAVAPTGGASLLRWHVDTDPGDEPSEQRFYRCTAGGCTAVGDQDEPSDWAHMGVTPGGAAFLAGEGAVEGCPATRLCSRRLPAG